MEPKSRAVNLLERGLLPSEIATQMGISAESVVQSLRTRVGDGSLRFSEIFFCWPPATQGLLRKAAEKTRSRPPSRRWLRQHGLTLDDVTFYRSIYKRSVFAGDLYEDVAEAEIAIHDMVRSVLMDKFGEGEKGYWRHGIPLAIRQKCQGRREADELASELPFQYTTLIELGDIIYAQWKHFHPILPRHYAANKMVLKRDFNRLNGIRNEVMHPVKRKEWSGDDFRFARQLRTAFAKFRDPA